MADGIQLLKRKGLSVVEVNLVALSPADVAIWWPICSGPIPKESGR